MSEISSIDDLLMGVGNSQQAATPEHKEKLQQQSEEKAEIEEMDDETPNYDDTDDSDDDTDDKPNEKDDLDDESDESDDDSDKKTDESNTDNDDIDEYGNKKERIPPGMKERLDRKEKQHQREMEQREREIQALRQQLSQQGASKEVQQAVKDFKYDPNDDVSWEQQLSDFVKQTISNMQQDEQRQRREMQEQAAHREFAQRFTQGMERFSDFREVVGAQPMDDAMTLALRGMKDPAAFIYAASKRNPQEIERISKLPDPYARMVEMGKLEERMRRNKPITKTPRPLGRTREDTTAKPVPKEKKDMSGDDLLAKADAKRLAAVKNRHRANR